MHLIADEGHFAPARKHAKAGGVAKIPSPCAALAGSLPATVRPAHGMIDEDTPPEGKDFTPGSPLRFALKWMKEQEHGSSGH